MGRYPHRIALSDRRIVALTDTHVSFAWKDYADHNRSKIMTLTIEEFIRRFLLHIVPLHFVRIRYYGFMSARSRKVKLQLCRDQTGTPEPAESIVVSSATSEDPEKPPVRMWASCPECGSKRMCVVREISKPDPGGYLAQAA